MDIEKTESYYNQIRNEYVCDCEYCRNNINEVEQSGFVKEDMDETVFMFALFKCRKFDKRKN